MKIGQRVKLITGETGWVIDRLDDHTPVVCLDHSAIVKVCSANILFTDSQNPFFIHKTARKQRFKMPVEYGVKIGFKKVAFDHYEFQPTPHMAKKYPWDLGSIWKTVESDGKKYLIKDDKFNVTAATGEPPMNNPVENDGATPDPPTSRIPIFDSGEEGTSKTYSKKEFDKESQFNPMAGIKDIDLSNVRPGIISIDQNIPNQTDNNNNQAFNYSEDWVGGVEITMNDESIAYLQPGDEAHQFLTDVENMDDMQLQYYLSQYSVLIES